MSTKAVKSTTTKKSVSVKSAPKVVEPVVEEPVVVAPPPVPTPDVVEDVKPSTDNIEHDHHESANIRQRLDALIKSRQDLMVELKKEIAELKKLQKDHDLEVKNASKRHKKKRSSDDSTSTRKPSGFASPVVVSDKLYDFLAQFGVEKGQPIARTDVTRHITNYISEHKLQNPDFRREIMPDNALKGLFGEPFEHKVKGDSSSPLVYTYLQLQRYLSPHFPKSAKAK